MLPKQAASRRSATRLCAKKRKARKPGDKGRGASKLIAWVTHLLPKRVNTFVTQAGRLEAERVEAGRQAAESAKAWRHNAGRLEAHRLGDTLVN